MNAMNWMKTRRALSAVLATLTLGGLLAAPITAHAQDGKGKNKKGDSGQIIVGAPIITNDPPPKKK